MIFKFFQGVFYDFLTEELSFTMKMIKKSFSNFSAWHYRSKLITLDLPKKRINWSSENILNYFKEDLHYLKNAIFTDPRDQSPWNYHNWILGNVTPIILKNFKFELAKLSRTDAHHDLKEVFKNSMYTDDQKVRAAFDSGIPYPASEAYHEDEAFAAVMISADTNGNTILINGPRNLSEALNSVPDCTAEYNPNFSLFDIGVAGTSYYGGVIESRFVLSNSFVQSQYTKSACLTGRTDGDLIPNHFCNRRHLNKSNGG